MKIIFVDISATKTNLVDINAFSKAFIKKEFHNFAFVSWADGKINRSKLAEVNSKIELVESSDSDLNFLPSKLRLMMFDLPPFSFVENQRIQGLEGKLLDLFCEKFNLTYKISNSQTKKFLLEDILEFMPKTELITYTLFHVQNHKNKEIIDFYAWDGMCFLVPINIPLSSYENLSFPFDMKVNIIFFIASVSLIFAWKIISNKSRSHFRWSFITLSVFKMVLGSGFEKEKSTNRKEKTLLYSFIIGNMLLVNLYQSFIISVMLSEPALRSVETIQELNESNTKIFRFFNDFDIKFRESKIVHSIQFSHEFSFELPEQFDVNMAYFVSCQYADFIVKSHDNYRGKSKIFNKLPSPLAMIPVSYTVTRNFPLIKELKFIINALRESGLRDRWINEIVEENNDKEASESKTDIIFSDNLRVPIFVLMLGASVGFAIFVAELIFSKFLMWRLKLQQISRVKKYKGQEQNLKFIEVREFKRNV